MASLTKDEPMASRKKTTPRFEGSLSLGEAQTIKAGKFEVTARVEYDDNTGAPWEEHDGHGPVSDWTGRDKHPGERVLTDDNRGWRRYYDIQEATKIARRDGWDAPPYGEGTAGQRAARAVEVDFRRLRDWCRDEWCWVGVVLSVSRNGVVLDKYAASLWGIESDAEEYLAEVANELLSEALESGESVLAKLK